MPPRRLAAVVLTLALLALPSGGGAQPSRAERPSYAVGDAWVLTDAAYQLARVERGSYVFTAAGEREIRLTRELSITYVRRGGETLEIQEPPRLAWPLEPGKQSFGRSIVRLGGAHPEVEVYATARVEAAESVRMAGGTFETLRIRYTFDPEIPGQLVSAHQRLGSFAREVAFELSVW